MLRKCCRPARISKEKSARSASCAENENPAVLGLMNRDFQPRFSTAINTSNEGCNMRGRCRSLLFGSVCAFVVVFALPQITEAQCSSCGTCGGCSTCNSCSSCGTCGSCGSCSSCGFAPVYQPSPCSSCGVNDPGPFFPPRMPTLTPNTTFTTWRLGDVVIYANAPVGQYMAQSAAARNGLAPNNRAANMSPPKSTSPRGPLKLSVARERSDRSFQLSGEPRMIY